MYVNRPQIDAIYLFLIVLFTHLMLKDYQINVPIKITCIYSNDSIHTLVKEHLNLENALVLF